jgi:hypothetical protein
MRIKRIEQLAAILVAALILILSGCVSNEAKESVGPYSVTFAGMENFKPDSNELTGTHFITDDGVGYTQCSRNFWIKDKNGDIGIGFITVSVNKFDSPMYQEPDNGSSALVKLYSPSSKNTNKSVKSITVDGKSGILITSDSTEFGYAGADHRVAYWLDPRTSISEITLEEINNTNWAAFDTAMTTIQMKK